MGEPQREQKWRRLPGDDSKPARASAPATSSKLSLRTSRFVANEAPLARRHCWQWQWYIVRGAPRIR
jgi:hypothetical protein